MLQNLLPKETIAIQKMITVAGKAMGFELFAPGVNDKYEVLIRDPKVSGLQYVWSPIYNKQHTQEIINKLQLRVEARVDTIEVFFNESDAEMLSIKSICSDSLISLSVIQAAAKIGELTPDPCLLCEQNIPHSNCTTC